MVGTAEERLINIKAITGLGESKVGTVVVTPDMARQLLVYNTNNRKLSDLTVKRYAEQMRDGKWKFDASMICFSNNGELSNGQHRLNAVIRAGIDVEFVIALGVDNFAEMDRGRGRTIIDNIGTSDKFKDTDIGKCVEVQQVASTAARIITGKGRISTDDALSILEKYGDDLMFLYKEGVLFGAKNLSSRSVAVAVLVAYENGVNLDLLKRFREVLTTGMAEGEKDAPIIALRDKLLKLKGGGNSVEKDRYRMTLYCIDSIERGLVRKACKSAEPKYTLALS